MQAAPCTAVGHGLWRSFNCWGAKKGEAKKTIRSRFHTTSLELPLRVQLRFCEMLRCVASFLFRLQAPRLATTHLGNLHTSKMKQKKATKYKPHLHFTFNGLRLASRWMMSKKFQKSPRRRGIHMNCGGNQRWFLLVRETLETFRDFSGFNFPETFESFQKVKKVTFCSFKNPTNIEHSNKEWINNACK